MMKWTRNMLLMPVLMVQAFSSCSLIDEPERDNGVDTSLPPQQVDLIICVGDKASKTRQMSANAATRAATFQGMAGLVAIPFHTDGQPVASTDAPLINVVEATEKSSRVTAHNNYYVGSCYFMTGTNRMLVYGKSEPEWTEDKTKNGELSALPATRMLPDSIRFSLTSIRNTTEAHDDAKALATYMTNIANATGWSTTGNPTLKSYYMDFTGAKSEGGGLMSGSAAHIKAFVAALKAQLTGKDGVSTAIKAAIDNNSSIASNTYPRSIGLPDGAAVIRWTGSKFDVRTTTTSLDNINGINRYTYPAELMFFTDSPIRTSMAEVPKSTYENASANTAWSDFLNAHYNSSLSVRTETKAVAVENPLQFGVANLQLTLTGMNSGLKDAKEETVSNADMDHLPLTGVIIGGQHTVGYNMKPQGKQTDVDGRFIYETNITSGVEGKSINTLVLQSYDEEKVPIILEFENRTDYSFTGKDGVVYPGTRFYLIGMIDPKDKGIGEYANRVFTQDHTTTMTMSVASLAKAYTCMPDLLAPRLEVGVQIVTHWIQSTTTNVEL